VLNERAISEREVFVVMLMDSELRGHPHSEFSWRGSFFFFLSHTRFPSITKTWHGTNTYDLWSHSCWRIWKRKFWLQCRAVWVHKQADTVPVVSRTRRIYWASPLQWRCCRVVFRYRP